MTDNHTITPAAEQEIEELYGPVAAREFANSYDSHKPGLLEWARTLKDMSDAQLVREGTGWILDSARMGSFRGNFNDLHFRATAFFGESKRRYEAAGHDEDCQGDTLYAKAYNAAWESQGHPRRTRYACTCGKVS